MSQPNSSDEKVDYVDSFFEPDKVDGLRTSLTLGLILTVLFCYTAWSVDRPGSLLHRLAAGEFTASFTDENKVPLAEYRSMPATFCSRQAYSEFAKVHSMYEHLECDFATDIAKAFLNIPRGDSPHAVLDFQSPKTERFYHLEATYAEDHIAVVDTADGLLWVVIS